MNEDTDESLNEESAQGEAVKSLIRSDPKNRIDDEKKSDISEADVNRHAILSTTSDVIEMKPEDFTKNCVLGMLINRKESKAWSKNRESRKEIVEIAKQRDMNMGTGEEVQRHGFIRRMFTSKNNNP